MDIFPLVRELRNVIRSKRRQRKRCALHDPQQRLIEQHPQTTISKAIFILDLPDLCQREVFRFLDITALAACQLTCRKWNTLINSSLKRLPKRELYRVQINFNDRKITMQWLTNNHPITFKYRIFEFESVELLSKQMTHFVIEECHLIGSNMLINLPKLHLSEQKVKTLEIRHLTVPLVGQEKETLLNFIASLEKSIEVLKFNSNCDLGLTLNDEFFAHPWIAKLRNLKLYCKSDITVEILKLFDRKKLSNLIINNNETPIAAQSIAEFISATVIGDPAVYLWVRLDVEQLHEILQGFRLSVTVENNVSYWTDLIVCRNSCILAEITVYQP